MAEPTHIEWTDAAWNPVTGCSVVSPGCANCYAMRLAGTRLQHHESRAGLTTPSKAGPVWNGQVRLNERWLTQPLAWKRPRRIFVCAHGDLFHESVPDAWIDKVFAVMALAPQHAFQVLTKRSARMRAYFSDEAFSLGKITGLVLDHVQRHGAHVPALSYPLPNVWLGVSAEDQTRYLERYADLRETPAAVRFISAEPLIAPIDFAADPMWGGCRDPDWVIAGGESGAGARPMHPDWPRQLRDQCAAAGVPFFFKQWGEWAPVCAIPDTDIYYHPAPVRHPQASRRCKVDDLVMHDDGRLFRGRDRYSAVAYAGGVGAMMMMAIGKHAAGRLLDGAAHDAMPAGAPR